MLIRNSTLHRSLAHLFQIGNFFACQRYVEPCHLKPPSRLSSPSRPMLTESVSVRSVSSPRRIHAPLCGGSVVPSAPICPIQDRIFSAVINTPVYGRIIVMTQLPSKLLRKLINRECDHAILQACGVIIRLTSRTDRSMTRAWK